MSFDLPSDIRALYIDLRRLPDGRWIGVHRLLFHWTLHIDINWVGYHDRYCYPTRQSALDAMWSWDGTGDPDGWHRHPSSGRARDPKTGVVWEHGRLPPRGIPALPENYGAIR